MTNNTTSNRRFLLLRCIFLLLLLIVFNRVQAQYYDIGEDPASVKWNYLRSNHFELLYHRGDTADFAPGSGRAVRYLQLMEVCYGSLSDSSSYTYGLGEKLFGSRFPAILHPYNANSNGVTVWAPRQVDFYAIPSPDILYPARWESSLALHEGRHVWQIAHFNQPGPLRIFYWLFGDQATGAFSGIYPSSWMLEGDAVIAETEMSTTGRGRNGEFIEKIKGVASERGSYGTPRSWDRWRLGSFKHYNIGSYGLGYLINSMARHKSGNYNLTHDFLNYEVAHPLNPNVVAAAFKNLTGYSHRDFVKDSLLSEWCALNTNHRMEALLDSCAVAGATAQDISMVGSMVYPSRTGEKVGYYTNITNIKEIGRDSVVAVINGYGTATFLALIYNRPDEEWVCEPLRYFSSYASTFSVWGNCIYWSEVVGDKRWGQKAVSKIFRYNYKTREIAELLKTPDSNLYSPVLNNGVLYAIEYKPDNDTTSILAFNLSDIEKGGNEGGLIYSCDEQITEIAVSGERLYFTSVGDAGLSLWSIDLDSAGLSAAQCPEVILPPSNHTITELLAKGNGIYYISDYYGSTILCAMEEGVQYVASTHRPIVSFDLSSEEGSAYITQSNKDMGARPLKIKLQRISASADYEFDYPLAEELSSQFKEEREQEGRLISLDNLQAVPISEGKYRRGAHLFKVHSWAPIYADVSSVADSDFDDVLSSSSIGASLYLQNTLGTMEGLLGYSCTGVSGDAGNKTLHGVHGRLEYSGWYPVLEAEVHYNDREMVSPWRHSLRASASAYIPITFNNAGWLRGISPKIGWSYQNSLEITNTTYVQNGLTIDTVRTLSNRDVHRITLGISGYAMLPTARGQIYPRLGIGGSFYAGIAPAHTGDDGLLYATRIYGYLPGFFFNHSFKITASLQYESTGANPYWQGNLLSSPRGYTKSLHGSQYYKITFDYAMPIYLGDISIGALAYLKRLDLIPFIDYAGVKQSGYLSSESGTIAYDGWSKVCSYGGDIILNANFFRIGFPVAVGVRYAYTCKPTDYRSPSYPGTGGHHYLGLLFSVSIN